MNDTTKVEALKIITRTDTITLQVDKQLLKSSFKEKSPDTFQILAVVLPILAALITLALTKWFDFIFENKKFRNEIFKKNRIDKVNILRQLNELKTSLHKINIPNPELEDFYENIADKMIGINPFHDLEINCNILFNRDIIDLTNKLYYKAEEINSNFNWKKKEHPFESIKLSQDISEDLDTIIDMISQSIKNE